MYLIARISSLWALRAYVITATLLMLLSITLMSGASTGHVQAHAFLRSNVNHARVDPNATITNISVSFFTHNDNKDHDTSISVLVQVPVNFYLSQDLARLDNFAGGDNDEFGDNPPSTHTFNLTLASRNIKLSDITNLPTFRITIAPNGHDRWIFDATFRITLSDGTQLSFTTTNIILDQDNRIYVGAFHNSN
ncbi:MAG TPA: hypothetical protein VKR06_40210 [Ktedonosporobacter sp.]|nr:hypothetical protein [Ktedonosporobacter sp.]